VEPRFVGGDPKPTLMIAFGTPAPFSSFKKADFVEIGRWDGFPGVGGRWIWTRVELGWPG